MHVKKGDTVIVIAGKDKGKKVAFSLLIRRKNAFWLKVSTS